MVTDTSVTPEKKLTGAALAAPDVPGTDPAMAAARAQFARGLDPDSPPAVNRRLDAIEARLATIEQR